MTQNQKLYLCKGEGKTQNAIEFISFVLLLGMGPDLKGSFITSETPQGKRDHLFVSIINWRQLLGSGCGSVSTSVHSAGTPSVLGRVSEQRVFWVLAGWTMGLGGKGKHQFSPWWRPGGMCCSMRSVTASG